MEEWRATKYPGYEVSSYGRVRSIDRIDSAGRFRRGRILKPAGSGSSGKYQMIVVSINGKTTDVKIHQLVLETFVEPRPEDRPFACHYDDDQSNNFLENLYWGTWEDCLEDKKRNGKANRHANKTHCPAGHEYDHIDSRGYRGCTQCRKEARERSRRKRFLALDQTT